MNASGSHKLKLFVIGKSENPRAFKNFNNKPVHYRGNKNAWMTYVVFEDWFKNVFVPEVCILIGYIRKRVFLVRVLF